MGLYQGLFGSRRTDSNRLLTFLYRCEVRASKDRCYPGGYAHLAAIRSNDHAGLIRYLITSNDVTREATVIEGRFMGELEGVSAFFVRCRFVGENATVFDLNQLPFGRRTNTNQQLRSCFLTIDKFVRLVC